MSNNSINLVSTRNEQLDRELRVLFFTRVIAVSLLITVAVVSIFAFILAETNPLSKTKQDEASVLANISAQHKKLATYYLIKDRLNNISNLRASRKDYSTSMGVILEQAPSDSEVTKVEIVKNNITFDVTSTSLVGLNDMINNIISIASSGKEIKNAKLVSLNLDSVSGKYTIEIAVEAI